MKNSFYLKTSMFTELGKYKEEAIDLFVNKCGKDLKKLCYYLMNATVHPVVVQWAIKGINVKEYGDFSYLDYISPMCEDDIFLTASSIFCELFRRDKKGFYIGRPVNKRLVLTCRYISILTSAILKANNIPCRSRAGWARYLFEKNADHFVNEYYNAKEKRWIMIDLDDLYDRDWMTYELYEKNKIADEYLDMSKNQFYSAAEMWIMFRQDPKILKTLMYGSDEATPENVLNYLFLDFWAVMNMEYSYTFKPVVFDKPFEKLTLAELKQIDSLANLMLEVDKNFDKLQELFNTTPEFRMISSPLVGSEDYKGLIKKRK